MQLRALGAFAAIAFLLAAIGIHGLLSFAVSHRSQEIGVRIALGARWGNILTMVLRQGMVLTVIGVALGISAAFWLTRFLASFLFGVKSWDPMVFVTVPIVLCLVALLAVWLPATRASKLNPMQALRVE